MQSQTDFSGLVQNELNEYCCQSKIVQQIKKQHPELNRTSLQQMRQSNPNFEDLLRQPNPLKDMDSSIQQSGRQKNCFFKDMARNYHNLVFFSNLKRAMNLLLALVCILESVEAFQYLPLLFYLEICLQSYFSLDLLLALSEFAPYTTLDLLIEAIFVITGFLSLSIQHQTATRVFKAIRTCKLFFFVLDFSFLKLPFSRMYHSIQSAIKILFPALLAITFYSISGLHYFSDVEYNKCRTVENQYLLSDWTVYEEDFFLCGQKECPYFNGTQLQCLNPILFGVEPNPRELINIKQGNGIMHYQNIWFAFLSTTKQIFITGSSRLIILYKQALNPVFVIVYYMSFIYFISYIYLNIFYGLMILSEEQNEFIEQSGQGSRRSRVFTIKKQENPTESSSGLSDQSKSQIDCQNLQKQVLPAIESCSIMGQNEKTFTTHNEANKDQVQSPIKSNKRFSNIFNAIHNIETNSVDQQLAAIWNEQNPQLEQSKVSIAPSNKSFTVERILNKKNQQQSKNKVKIKKNSKSSQHEEEFPPLSLQEQIEKDSFTVIYKKLVEIKHLNVLITNLNYLLYFTSSSNHPQIVQIANIIDFMVFWIFCLEVLAMAYFTIRYNQKLTNCNICQVMIFVVSTAGNFCYWIVLDQNLDMFLSSNTTLHFFFRAVKFLRIFIVLSESHHYEQVKAIFIFAVNSVVNVKWFIVLGLYLLMIFALVGIKLFGYRTKINSQGELDLSEGTSHEINYDGFENGLIFTFLTFYNEEWDIFMFEQFLGSGFEVVIWQYLSTTIGFVFLSKYFMALLIDEIGKSLDNDSDFEVQEQSKADIDGAITINKAQRQLNKNQGLFSNRINTFQKFNPGTVFNKKKSQTRSKPCLSIKLQELSEYSSPQSLNSMSSSHSSSVCSPQPMSIQEDRINQIVKDFQSRIDIGTNNNLLKTRKRLLRNKHQLAKQINGHNFQEFERLEKQKLGFGRCDKNNAEKSLFEKVFDVMGCKRYYQIKLFFILCSCLSQALYNRQIPHSENIISAGLFYISFAYFSLEIVFGLRVYGFRGEFSYFRRSNSNKLNIMACLLEALYFIPDFQNNKILRFLVVLKCIRALNLIDYKYRYCKNMRLTILSFTRLIPKVISLLLIMFFFFLFFGMLFTHAYRDSFQKCVNFASSEQLIITEADCYSWGGDWVQQKIKPSNLINSLLYFFLIATTEGWSSLMSTAASLRGKGLQPVQGSNPSMYYIFISFFFLGNMILLNIFIGISIYNFKKIKENVTGESNLDKDEREWFSIKSQIYRLEPVPYPVPKDNCIQGWAFRILKCSFFGYVNLTMSAIFIVLMCLKHTNQSQVFEDLIWNGIQVFIIYNSIAFLLSWLAYGSRVSYWGMVDFILSHVCQGYSIVLLFLNCFSDWDYWSFESKKVAMGSLCMLYLAKVFMVIAEVKIIKRLTNSFICVLPQTKNLFLILLIVLYIYTVIGVELFGYLKPNTELNEFDQNYQTFQSALYALIKFSTMESPIGQISDASSQLSPDFVCFEITNYDDFMTYGQNGCGNQVAAYLFFFSFHIIYSILLMSTIMAVTFDAYREVYKQEQAMVNKFQLQEVKQEWAKFDTEATGFLMYRDFWLFTAKLIKIYSFDKDGIMSNTSKQKFLEALNVPIYQDVDGILSFQFHEVIEGLTRQYILEKKGQNFDTSQTDQLFEELQMKHQLTKVTKSSYNSSQVLTLIIVKSGLKAWKRKAMAATHDGTLEDRMKFLGKSLVFKNIHQSSGDIKNEDERLKEEKIIDLVSLLKKCAEQQKSKQENIQPPGQIPNKNVKFDVSEERVEEQLELDAFRKPQTQHETDHQEPNKKSQKTRENISKSLTSLKSGGRRKPKIQRGTSSKNNLHITKSISYAQSEQREELSDQRELESEISDVQI